MTDNAEPIPQTPITDRVQARYLVPPSPDDPEAQRHGLLTIDGVEYWGPLPPNDGQLRFIFDEWQGEGGEITDDPGLYMQGPGSGAPGPAPERGYTFLEFMELFTPDEQMALAGAAMQDVQAKLWYDKAMGATSIFMSDQRTIDGVNAMAAKGLFSQERADKVLKGEPPS
jgi:hypothetical protein